MSLRGRTTFPSSLARSTRPRRSLASAGAAGGTGAALAEFLSQTAGDMIQDAQTADAEQVAIQARQEGAAAGVKAGADGGVIALAPGDTVRAKAFNDAMVGGYTASLDVYTHAKATEWKAQYADNPDGFKDQWAALSAGLVRNQPAELQPEVQAQLLKRGALMHSDLVAAKATKDLRLAEDRANGDMLSAMLNADGQSEQAWRSGNATAAAGHDATWADYLTRRTDLHETQKVQLADGFRRNRARAAVLGEFDRVKAKGLDAAEAFVRRLPAAHKDQDPDDLTRWQAEMERGLSDLKEQRREALSALHDQAADALFRAERGYGAQPLVDLANKARTLGDDRLAARLSQTVRAADLAVDLAHMPLPALAAKAQDYEQTAKAGGDPRRAEIARSVLAEQSKALATDAIGHTRRQGFAVPAIDWSNPDSLAERTRFADRLSGIHKIPVSALDKAELADLHARLDAGSPDDKARLLGSLAKGFGTRRLPEVLDAIGAKDNETAQAGAIAARGGNGGQVARDILFGQALRKSLSSDKAGGGRQYLPPKDEAFRLFFETALPPAALAAMAPEDQAGIQQAVISSYAAKSHAAGKAHQVAVDPVLFRAAVTDVTGGVVAWNGKSFPAPRPGVTQADITKLVDGLTDNDFLMAQDKVTPAQVRHHGRFVMKEPGRYFVEIGGAFVHDKFGRPLELDLGFKARLNRMGAD
ncbi:hypothetical protein [Magnetospirillum moscoviense]|uniref:Uncharacterized protein n=1 Tax=Magnetospirillum moscoviense TaxID=1437059 RepID=A0A178MRL7_9PROT|nr:hypothetical protein [Magnetospirillum moscoviense]OAN50697.1 hypothetical protein A6A05_11875 [Magnetospirillum moscoviense]